MGGEDKMNDLLLVILFNLAIIVAIVLGFVIGFSTRISYLMMRKVWREMSDLWAELSIKKRRKRK